MDLSNKKVDAFLDSTCAYIKNKRVHSEIKKELNAHINESIKHYKDLDNDDEKATTLALDDIGSSSNLGKDLNETHKAKLDFRIIVILAVLFIIGLLGTMSFNKVVTFNHSNLIYIPLVAIVFLIGTYINFEFYKKIAIPLYIFGVLSLLPILTLRHIFMYILFYNEFIPAPIIILVGLSGIYLKLNFKNIKHTILGVILGLIPLGLFIINSVITSNGSSWDYRYITCKVLSFGYITGSALFITTIFFAIALLFVLYQNSKNIKLTVITGFIELAVLGICYFKLFKILYFYNDGWSYGTIATILKDAKFINVANLTGQYTKASSSAVAFTNVTGPHAAYPNSVYTLTNIISYAGWLFGIIAILLLIYFVFRMFKISNSIKNTFGRSIAFSISTTFAVIISFCVLMNLNIFPYVQLETPLLSYSGSSLISTFFLLGILNNIYKIKNLKRV